MNVSPVDILRKDNPNPKPMSKLLKAILIIVLFLFSMDFGLIKSKSFPQKITIKLVSLAITIFFGISNIINAYLSVSTNMTLRNIVWYLRYIIQVFSSTITLFLMPENKTFFSFLKTLHCIDAKIGEDSDSFGLDIKILIYLVTLIICKWVLSMLYCVDFNECLESIWLELLYFIPYSSIDMPVVFLFFIFYAARCRLVALRKCIEKSGCEPIQFQNVYQSLIDSTEIVKRAFDPIFCVAIIVDIPCIMIIIYQVIKEITVGSSLNNVTGYATEAALVSLSLMVIFMPAIAAGLLSNEVNKIKICFHNMLLEEKDLQKEQDIQKLINYIDARPFKFKVLEVFPMDATLPTTILNLCVTYIIVVLQLTHLF